MINFLDATLKVKAFGQKVTYDTVFLVGNFIKEYSLNNFVNFNSNSWYEYYQRKYNISSGKDYVKVIYNDVITVLKYMRIIDYDNKTYDIKITNLHLLNFISDSYSNSLACLYIYSKSILENENEIDNVTFALNNDDFNALESLQQKIKEKCGRVSQDDQKNTMRQIVGIWSFINDINKRPTRTGKISKIDNINSISHVPETEPGKTIANNYIKELNKKLIIEIINKLLFDSLIIDIDKIDIDKIDNNYFDDVNNNIKINSEKIDVSKEREISKIDLPKINSIISKNTDSLLVWGVNKIHEIMIDYVKINNPVYISYENRSDLYYENKETGQITIYEIKTINKKNYFNQICKAIGQLFYYKYQNFSGNPNINLIIACNKSIDDQVLTEMFKEFIEKNNINIKLEYLNIKEYLKSREDFKNLPNKLKNILLKLA